MIEAPINRIKNHLGNVPPATRQERGDNYIDTLQLALNTLRELMTSFNPDMQFKAVMAMLDFEKTRLRHDRTLAGMEITPPIDFEEPIFPLPKFDKPIINEIVDEDEEGPKLTDAQKAEFETMIDEAMESCDVQDSLSRDRFESELWGHVRDHGFEKMASNFRRCMDKRKAKAKSTPPYSGGTLAW